MRDAVNTGRAPKAWPFMSAPHHHDIQVTAEGVGVPGRQEVEFRDGKRIWLRRVIVNGAPHPYLRDLGEPLEGTRIDLRKLLADVEKELPTTSTRDVAGYVAISLRLKFQTLEAFAAAVAGGAAA